MGRYDYNLIAIGAGSAGLVSSYIASAVKAKVALVQKNLIGGGCLYNGCVPSKSLTASARTVKQIRMHEEYGLKNVHYKVDFPMVMERIQQIIA